MGCILNKDDLPQQRDGRWDWRAAVVNFLYGSVKFLYTFFLHPFLNFSDNQWVYISGMAIGRFLSKSN